MAEVAEFLTEISIDTTGLVVREERRSVVYPRFLAETGRVKYRCTDFKGVVAYAAYRARDACGLSGVVPRSADVAYMQQTPGGTNVHKELRKFLRTTRKVR